MLKSVSSITNAIGALNYKGTWNASTNTPTLASGVGKKGDYYVVSVAGSTALDGISNWGVGDLATFNGSIWQRVEGGADLNGVNLSVSGTTTLSGLTASTALALDASKNVVSVTNTGTGSNVLATAPTLVGNVSLSTGNVVIGTTAKGIDTSAANPMTFNINGSEAMRIDSAGNVGIGKTNPIFPLDVNGRIGNGANQYFFTQTFPNWTGAQKIIIPITSNTLSNVTTVMVELDIVFAVVGTSDSQSGAGKFILEIRNNGAASPTLMGTITTVHARTIASSWIAYVATGNGTGQLEISNNGAGWNYASGLNRIGLNIFASNAGVTVGTITVV
jgi:hypothetical protein